MSDANTFPHPILITGGAGCMMGTYFYFKNLKQYSLKNSITWQFGFLCAGLFRPEGLVFIFFLPLWNLTQNNSQKLKKLVQDYSLCIFFAILGLFAIMLLNVDLMNIMSSSRLAEFLNRPILFLNQLVKPLPFQTDNKYLSYLFENYSLIITYAILFSVLIFKWVKGLGVLHGGFFFYSFFATKKLINNYQKHIFFFLIISFILVSVNLFNVYVLTNRYWGFHWWWILIFITPVMSIILKDSKINKLIKNILGISLILLIFNSLIDSNKIIEQEIAVYLKENSLQQVDFQEHERIKYYFNYSVHNLVKNKTNQSSLLYKLYKFDAIVNLDQKQIIKKFPETKPKFILFQHVN